MGYQQKLLYISSLLVVGAAILVGIQKFESSSMEADINALTLDLLEISTKAQAYYFKPKSLEGGGYSFSGLTTDPKDIEKLLIKPHNVNGTFKIVVSGNNDFLIIQAIGKNDYDGDSTNLTVEMKVCADSVQTAVVNY